MISKMRSFRLEPAKDERYRNYLIALLARVKEIQASDLHLTVGSPPILRISGTLFPSTSHDIVTESFVEDLLEILLNSGQQEILARMKDITFTQNFASGLRFKVKIFYQKDVPSLSFRFIPEMNFGIDSLGLPALIKTILKAHHGLIIISGPFDSGKSTSLAAVLNYINDTERRYIVTLEQPIEYFLPNTKSIIEQREIGVDTPSATAALRSLADEDVDVIALSNLDGKKMIMQTLSASAEGRMMIAVMNTNYSADCLEKIHGYFPAQEQPWARTILSENLLAILNQRLVPKIGGGRLLAYEFIANTPGVKNLIAEGTFFRLSRLIESTEDPGIISLERFLAMLVKKGTVKLEDAIFESQNRALLEHLVQMG